MRALLALILAVIFPATAFAGPKVVTSIVPVHSIVSAVMGETGTPELLLQGRLSEHSATFKPSQLASLGEADIVFIIGEGAEAKLTQLSGSETVNGKIFVQLALAPGVVTRPVRQGGAWEPDDHDHEAGEEEAGHDHDHDHDHGVLAFDPHVWLDPENAKAMAKAVAAELSKIDSANASAYESNAASFAAKIDAESAEISKALEPVSQQPFIVFHDAYQYFEKRFGLNGQGSISDVAAHSPSAKRLQDIRDKLASTNAVCVFREPQFDSKFVDVVIEGSKARSGVLDPLGADLQPGPDAYLQLLKNLSGNMAACLKG